MTRTVGYYPRLRLPPEVLSQPRLVALLRSLWSQRYVELYEEEATGSIEEAIGAVLDALWPPGDENGHRRWVAMARACALASEPTVGALEANNPEPRWALERAARFPAHGFPNPATAAIVHFPEEEIRGHQGLNEALGVFRNLVRALDPELARHALTEMLLDCLAGHAVFPGSDGRRDLFNWWLMEVVPAAWESRVPARTYSMKWPWPPPMNAPVP